jgi:hypothetical protein
MSAANYLQKIRVGKVQARNHLPGIPQSLRGCMQYLAVSFLHAGNDVAMS